MHNKKRGILLFLLMISLVPIISSAQESQADKCEGVKYKDLCYTLAAQSEKDKDICENILDEGVREECKDSASRTNPTYYITPMIILGLIVYLIKRKTVLLKKSEQKEIKAFIKEARARGYSTGQIKNHLVKNGFPAKCIEKILSEDKGHKKGGSS